MSNRIGSFSSASLKIVALMAALLALAVFVLSRASAEAAIPTFTIEDVVIDQTVTIQTKDFPPFQDFVVTMGPIGTLGINGDVVGITNSGLGGTFTAIYPIPPSLQGAREIAIRLESREGYYSYNWFYNNLDTERRQPTPTFAIESMVVNESVTIRTFNFPPDHTFLVTMGPMGTLGINGTPVGTIYSGGGGTIVATFPIPANLRGLERIAIRAQGNPWYAYNWFDNEPLTPVITPLFDVCIVTRDDLVTIRTVNFPANREFAVLMGPMGTLGAGGYVVGLFNSGPTGVGAGTFPIPDGLKGLDQIAIRTEETTGPYFSYNYFDNQTAIYCTP